MQRKHWTVLAFGVLMLLGFGSLNASDTGFQAIYGPLFGTLSSGELHLWLAWTLLAMPGSFMVAWAIAPKLAPRFAKFDGLEELSPSDEKKFLFAATLLIASFYRVMRALFLLDLPITDDEYSLSFGGQVLASGQLTTPLEIPPDMFPTLFLFATPEGNVTSFDFIGPQLIWAFSHVTGTGSWPFALLGALTLVGMWLALRAQMSAKWALAGTGLLFASPTMLGLSLTTHTHVASRAFLALFIAAYVWAKRTKSSKLWAAAGAAWGAAMIMRPVEVFLLTIPMLIMTLWDLKKDAPLKSAGIFIAASAPMAAIEIARNLALSGSFLPLRMAQNAYPNRAVSEGFLGFMDNPALLVNRIVHNVVTNIELLEIWFLGLPGLLLVIFGIANNTLNKRLAVGCALVLGFGIFHDNFGIHTLGPIHQSELLIAMSLFAVYGLRVIWSWMDEHELFVNKQRLAFVALGLALSLSILNLQNLLSVRRSQAIHQDIYAQVEAYDFPEKAIVLIPQLPHFWLKDAKSPRSWVFELRPPSPPEFADDPLLLRFTPTAREWVLKHYPNRPVFALMPGEGGEQFKLFDMRNQPKPPPKQPPSAGQ